MSIPDFRVVVAIDFGTTTSAPKNNTVLQYDDNSWDVIAWGYEALAREPRKKIRIVSKPEPKPVERFKLHLADLKDSDKPYLPPNLDYRKAISDFLKSMKPLILETLVNIWPNLKFPEHVRLVFTIPAEWSPEAIGILQDCILKAGYTTKNSKNNLEFTTEPEAAALYCMEKLEELRLSEGSTFMVVDCGGGTVDLTVRKLLSKNKLSEITERSGDLCGSTYVDDEFIVFLENKFGFGALDEFRRNHYDQYQYLILNFFCPRVKFGFDGNNSSFRTIDLDIEKFCPALMKYVNDDIKEEMEQEDWLLEIKYEDVRKMFDPVIEKIIRLIRNQLTSSKEKCSAMFIVGGFAESPYLVSKVKEAFNSAGVIYGLNKKTIATRQLKLNYGVQVYPLWKKGVDPKKRMTAEGRIYKFNCLAYRGKEYSPDKPFSSTYYPVYPDQTGINFKVYATARHNQRFCDEPGMKPIGELYVELPDVESKLDRPVFFSLMFGESLITATAQNKNTERIYTAEFKYTIPDFYFGPTTC
ncbi:8083_t:CDS:10 [Entrophospora sp. SA101]|nr:8083_t:CDS:10 [Entrophospora sp. SA101]